MPGAAWALGWDRAWVPESIAVPEARAWTRKALSGWDLTWLADDACFCVSELVTNSVVHAETSGPDAGITVRMWCWPCEALVIEVIDSDPRFPTIPAPEVLDPSTSAVENLPVRHRGLRAVQACAGWLTWERCAYGKSVWCRFMLAPIAPFAGATDPP
ncbi:anti-sigma regulatory factor (Ser/Thr protein kinase) [Embleya sp. AB8]